MDFEKYAEHEEAFLSCFFADADQSINNLISAGCNISPAMMSQQKTKIIYQAILKLSENKTNIDTITVSKESGIDDRIYIFDLQMLSKSPAYVVDYGRYILQAYQQKQLSAILETGLRMLEKENPNEVQKFIFTAYEKIGGYTPDRHEIKTFDEVATDYLLHEAKMIELEAQGLGITGSKFLDENIFFDLGYVMIIGGRSGVGKTTIGLKYLADYCKAYKTHGLFVSLEMPAIPIFRRAVTTEYYQEVQKHDSKQWAEKQIRLNRDKFVMKTIDKNNKILICDSQGVNLMDIEQQIHKARRMVSNLEICLIDYIGYVKPESGKTITEQIAVIAKGLKQLAKKLKIRLIVLSQLNRDGGTDGTTPVSIHHFKDSGAIEESADIAIGVWKSPEQQNRLHCQILKNREGENGIRTDYLRYGTYLEETEPLGEIVEPPKKKYK